jgi:hypothetical protein
VKGLAPLLAVLAVASCDKPAPPTVESVKTGPAPLANLRWRMDYAPNRSLAAFYAPGESDNLFYRVQCQGARLTVLIYMEPVTTADMPPFLELAVRDRGGAPITFARGRTRATEQGWAADLTLLSPFFEVANERPEMEVGIGAPDDPKPHWTDANDVIRDVLMDCADAVAN